MPNQQGFFCKIEGEIWVAIKSDYGSDIEAAVTEARKIRAKIQAELLDIPAKFTISEPKRITRRVAEPAKEPEPEPEPSKTGKAK